MARKWTVVMLRNGHVNVATKDGHPCGVWTVSGKPRWWDKLYKAERFAEGFAWAKAQVVDEAGLQAVYDEVDRQKIQQMLRKGM